MKIEQSSVINAGNTNNMYLRNTLKKPNNSISDIGGISQNNTKFIVKLPLMPVNNGVWKNSVIATKGLW